MFSLDLKPFITLTTWLKTATGRWQTCLQSLIGASMTVFTAYRLPNLSWKCFTKYDIQIVHFTHSAKQSKTTLMLSAINATIPSKANFREHVTERILQPATLPSPNFGLATNSTNLPKEDALKTCLENQISGHKDSSIDKCRLISKDKM